MGVRGTQVRERRRKKGQFNRLRILGGRSAQELQVTALGLYGRRRGTKVRIRMIHGELTHTDEHLSVSVTLETEQADHFLAALLEHEGYDAGGDPDYIATLKGRGAPGDIKKGVLEVCVGLEGNKSVLQIVQLNRGPVRVWAEHRLTGAQRRQLIAFLAPYLQWEVEGLPLPTEGATAVAPRKKKPSGSRPRTGASKKKTTTRKRRSQKPRKEGKA